MSTIETFLKLFSAAFLVAGLLAVAIIGIHTVYAVDYTWQRASAIIGFLFLTGAAGLLCLTAMRALVWPTDPSEILKIRRILHLYRTETPSKCQSPWLAKCAEEAIAKIDAAYPTRRR